MLNERGLTKVRSSEEAEELRVRRLSIEFPAKPPPYLYPPEPVMTGSAMNQQYQGRLRGHDLMMREIFLVWVLKRSRGKIRQRLFGTGKPISKSGTLILKSLVAAPLLFASRATGF